MDNFFARKDLGRIISIIFIILLAVVVIRLVALQEEIAALDKAIEENGCKALCFVPSWAEYIFNLSLLNNSNDTLYPMGQGQG